MEDRPLGHGRYHRPAVEPPADDGAVADPRPTPLSPAGVGRPDPGRRPRFALLAWLVPLPGDRPRSGRSCSSSRAGSSSGGSCRTCPLPGVVGAAIVDQRLRLGPPRERRRPRSAGSVAASVIVSAVILAFGLGGRRAVRHRWLAPLAAADRARAIVGCAPGRSPGLDHRRRDRPRGARRPDGQRLARDARRLGQRRLELERPAGPRRDRLEHRRPATSRPRSPTSPGVPLTYHWFADFHGAIASTVAGVDHHPGLLRHQRPLRRRPRASSSGRSRSD